jgi:leader peptidase (prepilin peptidase) / N-methyltransferase
VLIIDLQSFSVWEWYWLITAFVLGAVVGSFLNVVIARLPKEEESIFHPHYSKCPKCGHEIRFYDNIPILSYIILAGKCRDCGARIDKRYPFVELKMGLISAALMFHFGPSLVFGAFFYFSAAMIAVFWIDLEHMIIPADVLTFPGTAIGFLFALSGILPEMTWKSSLYGILLGAAILWIPHQLYLRIKGTEGLGMGDVYLLAMIGAFFGPYGVIFVLFMASCAGSLVALPNLILKRTDASTPIPFGPFITAAALIYLFIGPQIVDRFFGPTAPPL